MRRRNRIFDIFPILLFLVFTLSALGIVVASVQIYRTIVEQADGRFNTETAAAYITEKFRNHDTRGGIEVSDFMGHDAIALEETVKEVPYITYIYAYDGYLRELYVETAELDACTEDSGTKILEMESFNAKKLSDRLVRLEFTDTEGKEAETYIAIKSVAHDASYDGGAEE